MSRGLARPLLPNSGLVYGLLHYVFTKVKLYYQQWAVDYAPRKPTLGVAEAVACLYSRPRQNFGDLINRRSPYHHMLSVVG